MVIYKLSHFISWYISPTLSIFFFTSLRAIVVAKPLTSGILFSIAQIFVLKAVVVTKPLESENIFSTSPVFVKRTAVVAKPLTLGILFSPIFEILHRIFVLKAVVVIKPAT